MNVVLVYRGRYHVREALDLETLASVLRQAGHDVRFVYDPNTFGVTDNVFQVAPLARLFGREQQTATRVLAKPADVVLFSVLSNTFPWCGRIASRLKQARDIPIVFLGLHPSLVPERVMQHPAVDYVIAGECEGVVGPLLEKIAGGGDVSQVGNLWFRRAGGVEHTSRADLVDLEKLPMPDKDLFHPYVSHRYSYCTIVSRGCPYDCSFCEETCAKKLYGGTYFRRRSVDTVMRELIAGRNRYDYREVIFKDSYLSGNKSWLRELTERYRQEIGAPFKCFCTINGFDEETARLLKEAGCYSIEFGLQTWNDELRRQILNRRETNEDALRVFAHCDKLRLRYDVDHMFHLPTETEQDHCRGAEYYHGLRYLGRIKVHHLVYFPTADILEHAVAAGDLPADAARQLAEGHESDFYDQSNVREESARIVGGYAALYKILPLLPKRALNWFLKAGRVRWLRWIPSPVMALLQTAQALRSGDLRFAAYLRSYPVKVLHTLHPPKDC
jgi:hypothetical protein